MKSEKTMTMSERMKLMWKRAGQLMALTGIEKRAAAAFLKKNKQFAPLLDQKLDKRNSEVKKMLAAVHAAVGAPQQRVVVPRRKKSQPAVSMTRRRKPQPDVLLPYSTLEKICALAKDIGGLVTMQDGISQLEKIQLE